MIRGLAVAVLAACAGCSVPELPVDFPFNMWVDPTFDMRDQCLFEESLQRWHDATGGIAEVGVVYGWFSSEHYTKQATEAHAHDLGVSDAALGLNHTYPGGQTIYLWPERIASWVEWAQADPYKRFPYATYSHMMLRVMQHELGHHFGLAHTADTTSVMHETCGECLCIAQHDVDAFCAIYGCSLIAPACAPPPACE